MTESLHEASRHSPDALFIRFEDRTYSYAMFQRSVEEGASALRTLGLQPGERVLIISHRPDAVLLCAYACAHAGGVFVVLDPGISKANLAHVVSDCSPRWMLCDEDDVAQSGWHRAADTRLALPCLESTVAAARVAGADQGLICIVYTSGSTGRPKGVAITDANMRAVIPAIQARLAYAPSDVVAVYLPLSFDYGLYQVFLSCHARACAVLRRQAPTSALLARTIGQDGITVLPMVPSLCEALLACLKRREQEVAHLAMLRAITSTGQTLQPQVVDALQSRLPNVSIYPMYGLTECKRVSILLPHEYARKKGSVGRPLDGTQVHVRNAAGQALPAGEVGELVVEGPHLASYWLGGRGGDDGIVYRAEEGRRLYTGDQGHMDEEGFIFLLGRRDSLVKRRSHRVSLLEIETRLYELPYVQSTAVLYSACDDCLVAFIVPTAAGRLPAPANILEDLRRSLEAYKLPDVFIPMAELALNHNGKVDRAALLKAMQAHEQMASRKQVCEPNIQPLREMDEGRRPFFSIVVPTYNRPDLLRRALGSIRRQTCRDFEVLVVDDGSSRPCEKIVEEFSDLPLTLIANDSNKGAASARNAGIRLSRGRYVTFLDDDDEYLPGFLQETQSLMKRSQGSVAFSWCGVEILDEAACDAVAITCRTFATPPTSLARLLEDLFSIGIGFGVTVRADCFSRIGLFDESLRAVEDTDFFFRLILADYQPAIVPGMHLRLHNHRQSRLTGLANHGRRIQECRWLLTRYADFLTMNPTLRRQLQWQIHNLQHALAVSHDDHGK